MSNQWSPFLVLLLAFESFKFWWKNQKQYKKPSKRALEKTERMQKEYEKS